MQQTQNSKVSLKVRSGLNVEKLRRASTANDERPEKQSSSATTAEVQIANLNSEVSIQRSVPIDKQVMINIRCATTITFQDTKPSNTHAFAAVQKRNLRT